MYKYLFIFPEWLAESDLSQDFEERPKEELAEIFKNFFAEVAPQEKDVYQQNTYNSIRTGIQRYLTNPPFERCISIAKEPVFAGVKRVINGVLRQIQEAGKDRTTSYRPILAEDIRKIYESGQMEKSDPITLQNRVFF